MFVKTPTSSLTVGELLVNRLWYRTQAGIKWLLCGAPRTPKAPPSPFTKLPRELVEMIISCFIYDKHSLLACSMTCYSWYTATVSYLHHSLTTEENHPVWGLNDRYKWPAPLKKSYDLGLLPLVKRFRVRSDIGSDFEFTPDWLDGRTMRYFSALTNLQELGIDHLEIPSFMPDIRRCFGHFSPTLRLLALKKPRGSCRQILYFISLFPNLQDLKIIYQYPKDQQESEADATLVPLSVPPLRGRLTLTCFARETLVKDMIMLFGRLRFRHMDLFRVKCVRLLLDECAETLQTLRLYPSDPYENDGDLLKDFNLSRNKRLKSLETTAESIDVVLDTASDFLGTVLSSVRSSAPLDVVIIYRDIDLVGRSEKNALCHQRQLGVFRRMQNLRDFRLVLCAEVSDCIVEYTMGVLGRAMKGRQLPREPLIISERRTLHTRRGDENVGWRPNGAIRASAL